MNPNRKPSPRSVLKNLEPEVQDRLGEFLSESVTEKDESGKMRTRGRTLAEGVEFAADVLKVRTNDSSLSDWFPWWKMTRRLNSLADTADDLEAEMARVKLDPEVGAKIAQRYFLSRAAEDGDAKTFAMMASVIQRHLERKGQQEAHEDKMSIAKKKIRAQLVSLRIQKKRADAAEKRAAALELKNELMAKAAERAKNKAQSLTMSDEARAALVEHLDEVLLGKAAPKKGEPKA